MSDALDVGIEKGAAVPALQSSTADARLGQGELEPAQLVPGDADHARMTASKWRADAARAGRSGAATRGMQAVEGWRGESAQSYTAFVDKLAGHWETQRDALLTAARVLDDWADTVDWARGKASDAVAMYRDADRQQAARDLLDDALQQLADAQAHATARLDGLLQPAS